MRFLMLGLVLMAGAAIPAAAQKPETIDRRVDRIEQELRAVQRRVFPNAGSPYVAGEIQSQPITPTLSGSPASSPVADLTARVDALEAQLRAMTNQAEENSNRLRLLEQGIAQLRAENAARLDALEHAGAATAPASSTAESDEPQAPHAAPSRGQPYRPATAAEASARPATPVSTPSRGNSNVASRSDGAAPTATNEADAENAYNAGFHLWELKRYADAEQALIQVGKKYPSSKWASWANNLAGRAYLDDGKPVQAARILLANYQENPKGERAPDSLFYVGQALMAVGKPDAACKAYDELQDVYGRSLRDYLKQRLPAARADAKCR
ncbi:MAG: tetratricopeptide repeat protein [Alphaproteobacteria bacterium]|nr:tetratricopeptide repeat protein [Alphaproteobacteria bacterium]